VGDDDTKHIEAERVEVVIDRPNLPKDSEVVFDYKGSRQIVPLKAGATAFDQAQAAQRAFGMTVECGPIEEDGDRCTVHVYKP
jgi:ferric-dicitrate binding protein FerR (iron transport regulator)